jgi:hypothetical protein
MEKVYIICGSLVIPAVLITALVVTKRIIMQREKQASKELLQSKELITVLEQLVESKNEHIKHLK